MMTYFVPGNSVGFYQVDFGGNCFPKNRKFTRILKLGKSKSTNGNKRKGNNPDEFYYIYDFNGFVIVCIRLYGLSKIFELLWIFTDLVWRGKIKRSTFFSPY